MDKNVPAIVYMATNLINGKRYIGITCDYLSRRKSKHYYAAEKGIEKGMAIAKAIRKYGRNMIRFSILKRTETYDEAQREENRLIVALKPEYNMTAGGGGSLGYRHSEDAKRRMSLLARERRGYWKKENLPESFWSGRRKWNQSENGQRSWNECRKLGPISKKRPVICIDDNREFESLNFAALAYGINASALSELCNGKRGRKALGGKRFKYKETI